MAGDHWKQSNGNYSEWDSDPISKPGRFAGRPPIVRLARGFRLSPERRAWWRCLRQLVGNRTLGAAWIPAFAGKTGVVAVSPATRGQTDTGGRRGFRLSPERRVGRRRLRRLVGIRTLRGDVDSGFRRKDGRGGGVYGNSWATGHWGRRGFRLSPERRAWWRCLRQLVGKRTLGGDVDSGFRRKDGLGWRHLGRLVGIRTLGGDVDSGFRRRDGLGWRHLGRLVGIRTLGAAWIPAFAGKTGWAAASPATRGQTDTGGRRGFRLSPERRVGRAGSFETGGRAAGFGIVF